MAPDRPAALVTGSASGIGRAAALRLARAGYDVAINYSRSEDSARTTLADLESLGGRHLALRADVSDDAAVAALAAEAGGTFGRLDALVNNAGMTSQTPPDDLDGVDLDADAAERHRGRRGRDHLLACHLQPVRHRGDDRHRRRLRGYQLTPAGPMSPVR